MVGFVAHAPTQHNHAGNTRARSRVCCGAPHDERGGADPCKAVRALGTSNSAMVEQAMPWPARCHAAQIKPDMPCSSAPHCLKLLRAGAADRFD